MNFYNLHVIEIDSAWLNNPLSFEWLWLIHTNNPFSKPQKLNNSDDIAWFVEINKNNPTLYEVHN